MSLALTDGLLVAVCVLVNVQRHLPIAVRLSCVLLGLAAFLGVLRFSNIYPLVPSHQFFSLLGAVSALPLLCFASLSPNGLVARSKRFAWIVLCLTAIIGIMVSGLAQKRLYADATAVISVLIILVYQLRHKDWIAALGALTILIGLFLFASKLTIIAWLLPADYLHLGMSLGLALLARSAVWNTQVSAHQASGMIDSTSRA